MPSCQDQPVANALNVHQLGDPDGRAMLALHGVTGHGGQWRRVAEHLSGYRITAPDLRGHGRSTVEPPWTLERHTADALALLPAEPVVLVGFSFGGLVAARVATQVPDRIAALVLVDPAVEVDPAYASDTANLTRTSADLTAAREVQRYDWPEVPDEVVDRELAENWVRVDGRWRTRAEPAAVVAAWREMLRPAVPPPASVRTLVVRSLRSGIVPDSYLTGVTAPRHSAVDLDCGHVIPQDRPAELAALVDGFVRG